MATIANDVERKSPEARRLGRRLEISVMEDYVDEATNCRKKIREK